MSTRLVRVLFVCVVFPLTVTIAYSQDIWLGGPGNWRNSANWSTGIVPNSATADVEIDGGNPVISVVYFDSLVGSVGNLTLDSDDRLTIYNPSGFYSYGTLSNSGTLNSYTSLRGFYNFGTLSNSGTLNNSGLLDNYLFESTLTNSGTLNNSGSILSPGTLSNSGALNNSGFLNTLHLYNTSGGTLSNAGTFYTSGFHGGALYNYVNATLTNSGRFYNYGPLYNFNELINNSGGTLENHGALYNYSNATLTNYGTLINYGTLVIASGASLVNDNSFGLGTYTQSAGLTVVDGLFSGSTSIQINGGMLSGSGTIEGDVTMGGTLSPGDSLGKLTVQGNYTQLPGGNFFAELAGLAPGTQYDQLVVTGKAALDGTLDVALLNGFVVQLGDSFVLMTYGSESGQFSTRHLASLPFWESWQVSYNSNDLMLTAVPSPEPSSALLLGTGLLAGIVVLRRKLVS